MKKFTSPEAIEKYYFPKRYKRELIEAQEKREKELKQFKKKKK